MFEMIHIGPIGEIGPAATVVDYQRPCAAMAARGRRLVDAGAEAVVLAGTDLGLAFDGQETACRVIDALDVHVALLADLASGSRTLDALG